MSAETLTPMMRQYRQMKAQIPPDALLLFRLGDFYELFFEDAKTAAEILDVTLTARNGVPMCGVPYHAAPGYISRLVASGRRVAICEQMEQPRPGQVVRRDITQILSPGSVVEADTLEAARPNFLAAVAVGKKLHGFALLDTTTGEFRCCECETLAQVLDEIGKASPAEILLPDDVKELEGLKQTAPRSVVTKLDAWVFLHESAFFTLKDHFKVQSLDGFGCTRLTVGVGAAGALLHYLGTTLRRSLTHITRLRHEAPDERMPLDDSTRRTLELVEPSSVHGSRENTLLAVLDHTRTGMGARRLRDWLLAPLRRMDAILARQEAVAALNSDAYHMDELQAALGRVRDLERCLGRLAQGSGNGRDLIALAESLEAVPTLAMLTARARVDALSDGPPALLAEICAGLDPVPAVPALIRRAIDENCPALMRDGGVIASGYNAVLDELRAASREGKDWIARLQAQEQERTGIKSLKVRFNSVFGYYIEITRSNLDAVPADYQRKQTTANGERFITPELKEMESKILGAEDRAKLLEQELFAAVRAEILQEAAAIQRTAAQIGVLDATASLAQAARLGGYVRPVIVDEPVLELVEGRHPVLERLSLDERFVPNDCRLNGETERLIVLTGPNMAGKSTYLRQVALLALMAHCGSFLPVRSARVGLLDRIFTRVGASDDLARGQSTFMVEMNETANILHHATSRSLVVLDEIGRGTSTFDGLSIAWSVAEFLHNRLQALTLFATHYHETTALSAELPAAKLMNVSVREYQDQVIFLRKIVDGPADKSYGIQVARLAGLPNGVLDRARELLSDLEGGAAELHDRAASHLHEAEIPHDTEEVTEQDEDSAARVEEKKKAGKPRVKKPKEPSVAEAQTLQEVAPAPKPPQMSLF